MAFTKGFSQFPDVIQLYGLTGRSIRLRALTSDLPTAARLDSQGMLRFRFGGEDLELSARVNRVRPVMYVGSLEIVHHGRVASRANVGFVGPNVAVGYVRLFRTQGVSRPALTLYKLLVTLDAPVQLTCKLAQAGLRAARGEQAKAGKSLAAAAGLWRFATRELGRFWRA